MTTAGLAGPDPQRLAEATEECPSVARLHAGPAASYLPGKRVPGISIGDDTVTVHVDLAYPATVATLGQELRTALRGLTDGRRLAISVDDVILPGESTPAENTQGDPATGDSHSRLPASTPNPVSQPATTHGALT